MKDNEGKNVMNTSLVSSSSSVFEPSLHNGVKCIQSNIEEHKGTVNEFWFSVKLLCEIFDESKQTIGNNIKSLVEDGELDESKNFDTTIKYRDSQNREHSVKIYNLEVLNKLGMCCFRGNQKARDIRNKFNDVLVKEETKQNTLPALSEEDHFFLNILHAKGMEEIAVALKDYKSYRDEREQKLEQEKDDAVRKRHAINDKRTATLMVAKREDNKKINQLTYENNELREQNEILKVSIGESNQWMSSAQLIQNFDLQQINGKDMLPRTLTIKLKKLGCKHRESEFPDAKGYKYAIFFVEDVKKALNIF